MLFSHKGEPISPYDLVMWPVFSNETQCCPTLDLNFSRKDERYRVKILWQDVLLLHAFIHSLSWLCNQNTETIYSSNPAQSFFPDSCKPRTPSHRWVMWQMQQQQEQWVSAREQVGWDELGSARMSQVFVNWSGDEIKRFQGCSVFKQGRQDVEISRSLDCGLCEMSFEWWVDFPDRSERYLKKTRRWAH